MQQKKFFQSIFQPSVVSFVLLGQTRTFSEAGRILGITQSAVSKNVSNLEEQMGVKLVDRTTRPISLTRKGRLLFDFLVRESQAFKDMELSLTMDYRTKMVLNIGCPESLFGHLITPFIARYSKTLSQCKVHRGVSGKLLNDLDENEIDVFVSTDAFYQRSDLYRRFLYSEPVMLMFPKDMKEEKFKDWSDLDKISLPLILGTRYSTNDSMTRNHLTRMRIQFKSSIMMDNYLSTFDLVARGKGWTIQTPFTLALFPDLVDKIRVVPTFFKDEREFFLISKSSFDNKAFVDYLAEAFIDIIRTDLMPKTLSIAPGIKNRLKLGGGPAG